MTCDCSLIVIGEMNTDIIVTGLPRFPKAGELINGGKLFIGPGGKSRNIAAMAAALLPTGRVAMVSRTSQDKYGLWKEPVEALKQIGVNTKFVKIIDSQVTVELPGIALILVDQHGNNQIIGAPGITRKFSPEDIDEADELFKEVEKNNGFMVFIGNCPIQTAKHAIIKARKLGIKIVFDPGGADDLKSLITLLGDDIYLFKPNEHEARVMTGVNILDLPSAKKAAKVFMKMGVENVLITVGSNGAYLFTPDSDIHIPVPAVKESAEKDETGCGDQTMAAICALLLQDTSLYEAAKSAILAGTLQFHRRGIVPVTPTDLIKVST